MNMKGICFGMNGRGRAGCVITKDELRSWIATTCDSYWKKTNGYGMCSTGYPLLSREFRNMADTDSTPPSNGNPMKPYVKSAFMTRTLPIPIWADGSTKSRRDQR